MSLLDDWTEETPVGAWDQRSKSRPREREQVMDRYQVVTLQAAVYVVDNDEMQASRFAGDWNAHASCELLNSGAMPRTDLDWIDLEPETADPSSAHMDGGER